MNVCDNQSCWSLFAVTLQPMFPWCPSALLACALSFGATARVRGEVALQEPVSAGPTAKSQKRPPAVLHVPESIKKQRSASGMPDQGPATVFTLMPPEVMGALGRLVPTPGAWVEYGVREGGSEESRVRLSVLAPLLPEGRYWLEFVLASTAAIPVAARLLLKGDPFDPANIERLLIYVAGQAPLELPVDQATDAIAAQAKDDDGSPAPPTHKRPGATPAKVQKLGLQTITVRGGTFMTDKLRITDLRTHDSTLVWKSAALPLLPLVRAEAKTRTIELLSYGFTGAHSLIDAAQGEAPANPPPNP